MKKITFKTCIENTRKKINKLLEEEDNQLLKETKTSITDLLFKDINEDEHFVVNKIYFDITHYIELSKYKIFKKNSLVVHNFIKKLKAKSIISKNSYNYPKNHVLLTANPLNSAFLNLDLKKYDYIISLKNELIESLKDFSFDGNKDENLKKEIELFIFFKLFLLEKIPNSYYQYLKRDNILYLNNNIILVVKEDYKDSVRNLKQEFNNVNAEIIKQSNELLNCNKEMKNFIPLHKIIFNEFTSNIFKNIFPKKPSGLLDSNEYIFSKEYDFYDKELSKYLNKNELKVKTVKDSIKFEYLLKNTPLKLTLKTYFKYPPISLLEIEKLYPNTVSNIFLEIEKNNTKIYRKNNKEFDKKDDIDDELDIDKILDTNYELYEKLKELLKLKEGEKKDIKFFSDDNYYFSDYLKRNYLFIKRNKNKEKKLTPIFNYVEKTLKKSDKKNDGDILPKTLQQYLRILFYYCFDIIVKSPNYEEALKRIDYKLKNSNLNPNVQIKYQNIIRDFLNEELGLETSKIKSTVNCSRSIIFEDELDKTVDTLIKIDKKKYNSSYILTHRRAVFVILSYYTGLRKGELVSRTLNDLIHLKKEEDSNKFYIYINNEGINKINNEEGEKIVSLKNKNATRSFEFEITNKKYLGIVKKYYNQLKTKNITFLFPRRIFSESVSRNRVIKLNEIDKINTILQKITNRYVVIHSFRHTYATNEVRKILNNSNKKIDDIYDLVARMGHNDVETTISNYVHLDFYDLANKIETVKYSVSK